MIVANYTPDAISWMHVGITGTITPGEIVEVGEARGKHIVNKFGPRGLLQLQFEDKPELKKVEAMKIWSGFWENQVRTHNQHAEQQKEKGHAYPQPTKELLEHAEKIGIEVVQPWKAKTETGEVGELKAQLAAQKEESGKAFDAMMEQIRELSEKVVELSSGKQDSVPTEAEKALQEKIVATKRKYSHFGEKQSDRLMAWVKNNVEAIVSFPTANKIEIRDKVKEVLNRDLFLDGEMTKVNGDLL